MQFPQFSGIHVRNAWYTPAEFQNQATANIELELTGTDTDLKPDCASTDRFQLIRRGENGQFQVNSSGAGVHNERINLIDASHVQELLAALSAGNDVTFEPDVNNNRFQKALARLQEQ